MSRDRTFVRRCLGTVAAAGLSTLLVAGSAHAAELREIQGGHWNGSKTTTDLRVGISNPPIRATIKRANGVVPLDHVTIKLTSPAGLDGGCTGTVSPATRVGGNASNATQEWASNVSTNCNGVYGFTIDAAEERTLVSAPRIMEQLSSTIEIEVVPPTVTGVNATLAEGSRTVTVKWTAIPNQTPDFLGYQVQRRLGSAQWTTIASPAGTTTSIVDDGVPADPGDYSYRVLARRSGARDNVVTGAESNIDRVTLTAGDPTSSSTTVGDGSPPPTNPDGTPASTVPGDTTVTTPATTADGKVIPKVVNTRNRGRTGGGTPAPNLGRSTQSGLGVRLNPLAGEGGEGEEDGGFGETLPFGDPSIDEELADEGGSSLFYEGGAGRGMAVPVAVGFVFFAWAIHLRFLARASKPVQGQVEYDWDPFDPFYDPMS